MLNKNTNFIGKGKEHVLLFCYINDNETPIIISMRASICLNNHYK